jgi:hypothetical protein
MVILRVIRLGGAQSVSNLSRNYAKAMGHSGLPKKPDGHITSPGAIKCDLVVPITLTLEASFLHQDTFFES